MPPNPPANPQSASAGVRSEQRPVRVVGVGASAGGVDAYTRLLHALPADTGLAFVLVSHLSPHHPSELSPVLAPVTRMPVTEAVEGDALRANHVYTLPADKVLTLVDGHVHLEPRPASAGRPSIIDEFLASLAADLGPCAVGVILSGTGSDGTLGLQAIKSGGGITYAQDFTSAAYDSMPRNAVEAGWVDSVLRPEAIARSLADLAASGTPHVETGTWSPAVSPDEAPTPAESASASLTELPASEAGALTAILNILRAATGVDFRQYRQPGMLRRIRRRMDELSLENLVAYLPRLENEPAEVQALFKSVLIHVTEFFRDPESFQVLRSRVVPSLLSNRAADTYLRTWVVGCATGEEAYSVAMTLREADLEAPIRLFATDVSEAAIVLARRGRYSSGISTEVSPERLERFFTPVDGGYVVVPQLRDMCVFARHDVTHDPPFAQLDLVVCRNLLIYLEPRLQQRVLHNLYQALKPGGILLLGSAESVGHLVALFSQLDPRQRIYVRGSTSSRLQGDFGPASERRAAPLEKAAPPVVPHRTSADLQRAAEHAFFELYPSGSVILNANFDIVHFQGRTSPYLEVPTGGPTVQLLKMAHPDLRVPLGRLIRRAEKGRGQARKAGIPLMIGSRIRRVNVTVLPLPVDQGEGPHYLVVFESASERGEEPSAEARGANASKEEVAAAPRIRELEHELSEVRDYLQGVIDQQDATYTELQAAHQSTLSLNEEYHSTNEELESTKEELQSLNEELSTLNEELQHRNVELTGRTAQVTGLLEAMDMPILLVTPDLRLLAFNARAAADLRLSGAVVGHSLVESRAPVSLLMLSQMVDRAMCEGVVQEREVQDRQGTWRALRVWPVLAANEANAAAVVALIDVAALKAALADESAAREYSEAIVEAMMDPLLILDRDLKIVTANRAFHLTFGTAPAGVAGLGLWQLTGGDWNDAEFHRLLDEVRRSGTAFMNHEMALSSSEGRSRAFRVSGRRIVEFGSRSERENVLLALEDVTDRNLVREQLIRAGRMQAVGQLAGGVAHEINNQMHAVVGFAESLLKSSDLTPGQRADIVQISRAGQRAANVARQLLAFSRRQPLQLATLELNTVVANSESLLRRALGPNIALEVSLGEAVGQVRVDEALMEQVLVNLALNARDAMPRGGRLSIETASVIVADREHAAQEGSAVPRGTYFRLIVSDTGHGMDAATQARLFEPFFTTKPPGQGTGLGLASVYGTVKQSGGLIWVESEPGRGTTFTIDFPAVVGSAPPKPPAEVQRAEGGSETILVVEDEDSVRALICRSLSNLGYTALQASGSAEALQLVTELGTSMQLVLTDVIMPGMSGVELSHRIAEIRPGLPVVLISGLAVDELVHRGVAEPGMLVLQKPFGDDDLARVVRNALSSSGQSPTSS